MYTSGMAWPTRVYLGGGGGHVNAVRGAKIIRGECNTKTKSILLSNSEILAPNNNESNDS